MVNLLLGAHNRGMESGLRTFLQSSQDPTAVGNKVKGIILAGSAIIIFGAAQLFHITLTANDMISLSTEVGTVAGAVWAIYGAILHIVTWLGTVKTS